MDNKTVVITALNEIIANKKSDVETVTHYFSSDYQQNVNGQILTYNVFIDHIKRLHEVLASAQVKIIACTEEGDTVFTHHQVFAHKYDGTDVHTQVLAQFDLQNGKIIKCSELTHLLKGNNCDHTLGSMTH